MAGGGASGIVSDFALALGVAAAASLGLRRLGVPSIVSYLAAGLVIGPYLPIPIFADADRLNTLSEFGVVLVMFAVGLELRLRRLAEVLPASGVTGLVQMGGLWWLGLTLGGLFGWTANEALFLGGCLAVSSTMVVSKVMNEQAVPGAIRQHVFGVLVLQDVAAVGLITLYTALASGAGLTWLGFVGLLGGLLGALVGMIAVGMLFVPRLVRRVVAEDNSELLVLTATALCFGFALIAGSLGYSAALGAFVAGVLVAESGESHAVEHAVTPLKEVFAALFFVTVGMTVDPRLVWEHLGAVVVVSASVIVAQLVTVGGAGLLSGLGLRRALVAGLCLGQIGEFAFVIAGIGTKAGVVGPGLAAVTVAVAVVTAFTTPQLVARSERLVQRIDHALPRQVHAALALHEAWLERMRSSRSASGPLTRSMLAIGMDSLLLVVLLTFATLAGPTLAARAGELTELSDAQIKWGLRLGLLAAAAPIVAALVRSARGLAEALVARISADTQPSAAVLDALRFAVLLLVWLGVGIPLLGLLRPVLAGPLGPTVLFAVAVGLGVSLVRALRGRDEEVRSATARVVAVLAREGAPSETTAQTAAHADPAWLPPADQLSRLVIGAGTAADGRSLGQLDLRARTGATVVAIGRTDGETRSLPDGHALLVPGETLFLLGSPDAVRSAQALLEAAPESGSA